MGDAIGRVRSVCIVGGGTAGWMTAAALAYKFERSDMTIRLIESDAIGTVGVGEATLPHIRYFNQTLGIDEAEFMRATNATFKLGIEFCDWGRLGDRYIHPFGDFGQPLNDIGFHHIWTQLRQNGLSRALETYSYPVEIAKQGRFHRPHPDANRIESTFGYAYQFDSALYAKFLRRFAEERGVSRTEGKVVDVLRHAETGHVASLRLEDCSTIESEFYIDCSGFRGLLIEQSLSSGYQDWSEWLPCNRAIAVQTETRGPILPFTRATAREAGWQWRIPLQHRTGNGHVYCSNFISDDQARDRLMKSLDGTPRTEPKQLYFKTGRRNQFWSNNVVAIGLSAGFLEPLESTSIHLIQEGITTLIELFPGADFPASDQDEYNARMGLNFERVRDFLLLHYVATERDDTEMWRHFRALTLPDSLHEKIEAWKHRGHAPSYDLSVFLEPSWIAVFTGQRLLPEHVDPRLDSIPADTVSTHAESLRKTISSSVDKAPFHMDFIRQIGALGSDQMIA